MHIHRRWVLVAALGAALAAPAALTGQEGEHGEGAALAEALTRRLEATLRQDADHEAVDALLQLYAPGAVYEHPRVGIVIEGRDQIRSGMVQFLGLTRAPRVTLLGHTSGRGVLVVELQTRFEALGEDGWQPTERRAITVLELEEGRITRVIDYW